MASTIVGNKSLGGTVMGQWNQGLDAYSLAVRYKNYKGTLLEWLDSLKAVSPTFSEPVIDNENGTTTFTMTDENGEHTITLRNGLDISVESTEVTEDGTLVTFNDGTTVLVSNGQKGDQGEPGREVILRNIDNVLYQGYQGDPNLRELANLNQIVQQVYQANPPYVEVDELPDPANAIPGVVYRLKQNGGD